MNDLVVQRLIRADLTTADRTIAKDRLSELRTHRQIYDLYACIGLCVKTAVLSRNDLCGERDVQPIGLYCYLLSVRQTREQSL